VGALNSIIGDNMKDYKTNRFVLFQNDSKKAENHPDYRGLALVTQDMVGKELEIAGWVQEDKKGGQYISGTIQLKREKNDTKKEVEEDIPF
tara:strand:+ start:1001 stop:1273 length:273 start_codon:yes stop_codon:yes gene_type:complete